MLTLRGRIAPVAARLPPALRRFVMPLLVAVGGIAIGVLTAVGVLVLSFDAAWVHYGPWRTNALIGRPEADMYTRAQVAVGGVLALPTSEVVYLVAERDGEGRRIRSACTYRVSGESLPSGWWSLTVYGSDRYLVPNAEDRYSYTSSEIGGGTRWTITIARRASTGLWIPAGSRDQTLILVLRLYRPDKEWARELSGQQAPWILREGCE